MGIAHIDDWRSGCLRGGDIAGVAAAVKSAVEAESAGNDERERQCHCGGSPPSATAPGSDALDPVAQARSRLVLGDQGIQGRVQIGFNVIDSHDHSTFV
jgi:hypothetical protein